MKKWWAKKDRAVSVAPEVQKAIHAARIGFLVITVVSCVLFAWWFWPRDISVTSPDGKNKLVLSKGEEDHLTECRLHIHSEDPLSNILSEADFLTSTDSGRFTGAKWTSNHDVVVYGKGLEISLTKKPLQRGSVKVSFIEQ